MTTATSTASNDAKREQLRVSFDVDRQDFETARRIMTRLTKEEDPAIQLPLSDEQVAFSIYLYGFDAYMETYGEDGDDDERQDWESYWPTKVERAQPAS